MEIAIIGATGHAGSFILDEAFVQRVRCDGNRASSRKITIRCSVYTKGFI